MGGFIVKDITENLLLWEQRIKERTKSGMTIEQWCSENELSKHKYHYWNHRIKKNNQKQDRDMTFAEVTPILSSAGPGVQRADIPSDFQLFFKDIQVTIPSNFNKDSLAELLKVLQQL